MVTQTAQRDRLLLHGLGIILAVSGTALVLVLTDVDFELRIVYCHSFIGLVIRCLVV